MLHNSSNLSGVIGTEPISKNGSRLKSLMSRGKFLFSIFVLITTLLFSSCKKETPNTNKKIDGLTATGEAVMVMDTDMVSSKLKGITEDGTLVFNNLSAEDMPEKGDIICSAPSEGAPQGFLYRVKEVRTKGNETTIVTEFATIEEAVEEADVDQTLEFTIIEIEDVEGVEIEELQQVSNSQLRASSISQGIKLNIDKNIGDIQIGELHIKGSIELKTSVRCQIKIGFFQLNRFELSMQPQFKVAVKKLI